MVAARQSLTKAEFAEIDECGRFDLVDGELWSQRPTYVHENRCITGLFFALCEYGVDGELFGPSLGCDLDEAGATVLCPDVCYIRAERKPGPEVDGFFRGAPDLAVELVSDSEPPKWAQTKVARYLSAGTILVWCAYPDKLQVVVYSDQLPPQILGVDDTLDGGSVLPGFALPLVQLFA